MKMNETIAIIKQIRLDLSKYLKKITYEILSSSECQKKCDDFKQQNRHADYVRLTHEPSQYLLCYKNGVLRNEKLTALRVENILRVQNQLNNLETLLSDESKPSGELSFEIIENILNDGIARNDSLSIEFKKNMSFADNCNYVERMQYIKPYNKYQSFFVSIYHTSFLSSRAEASLRQGLQRLSTSIDYVLEKNYRRHLEHEVY